MKKDYCSCFPDVIQGVDISQCCKKHDNDSGQAGGWNFVKHQADFYTCVKSKLGITWGLLIASGGGLMVLVKLPWLMYKKYRYQENAK